MDFIEVLLILLGLFFKHLLSEDQGLFSLSVAFFSEKRAAERKVNNADADIPREIAPR